MFVHIVEACIRINWKPVNSECAIRQNSCYQGKNQQEGSTCKRKDNLHFLITSFYKSIKSNQTIFSLGFVCYSGFFDPRERRGGSVAEYSTRMRQIGVRSPVAA